MEITRPKISVYDLHDKPWLKEEWRAEQERYEMDLVRALTPTSLRSHSVAKIKTDWLVEGLLPKGFLAILAGEPKIGKTCFASALAIAVATGTPFAGRVTKQASVVWLCYEESPTERAALLRHTPSELKMHEGQEPRCTHISSIELPFSDTADYIPLFHVYDRVPIDTDDGIAVIDDLCRKVNAEFLVIDPLHTAHSGRSLQDGWSARKTLDKLKRLTDRRGVTTLVMHHISRRGPARIAENAQLAACASMFWLLRTRRDAEADNREITIISRGREIELNRTYSFLSPEPLRFQEVRGFRETKRAKPEPVTALGRPMRPIERAIVHALAKWPMTAKDLAEHADYHPGSIRNTLNNLESKRLVCACSVVGRSREFTITQEMRQHFESLEPKNASNVPNAQ